MKKYTLLFVLLAGLVQAQTVPSSDAGYEIGGQVGDYSYRENPNLMELHADGLLAVHGAITVDDILGLGPARLEGRFVHARTDYSSPSSGTSENSRNMYGEIRALRLNPMQVAYGEIIPYYGLGIRRLYNDLKDTATAFGYERISTYIYAPLGVAYHSPQTNYGGMALSGEFAPLLYGRQYSGINDGIENNQTEGYHLRLTALWENKQFQAGPYYQFWRVGDSDVDCSGSFCGVEPKNFTREFGFSVSYKF
ncbi:MAG: hypothetical protein OXR68_03835 [Alphaproteobacteria bacterium]|nr:hypothetical protein [Alphaproteobacteria bacterium]MDD9919736.1 hypothetical protein [Alphaproteobacteria bacterium]